MKNNIRFFREEAHLTQADLAASIQVEQSHISRLEKADNINVQLLNKIKRILNEHLPYAITIEDLMSDNIEKFKPSKRRVIALCGEKGGVGKTTFSFNIASGFALSGKKTMLIDLDAQMNATQCCVDLSRLDGRRSTWTMFSEYTPGQAQLRLHECAMEPDYAKLIPWLKLVPAHRQLSRAEKLYTFEDTYAPRILKQAIELEPDIEIFVIDCPGNVGILTLNALIASNEVIIPCLAGNFEAKAIADMKDTFEAARKMNSNFKIRGIILNKFQDRTHIAQVTEEAILAMGLSIFKTRIPNYVGIGEATAQRVPVFEYLPKDKSGIVMKQLVDEVIYG